ncbi:MAG: radical SAM family heme chaperone HemW [Myxococcales bacterium]|jgi:putative oxygen-independent coproporphyrinogen III oxidase
MAFAVYIHFPYCLSKCPYCDFASQATAVPHARYARAIARELALREREWRGRRAASLYLGGGTPSLWEPSALAEALDALRGQTPFAPDAELTIEANPGASDAARFRAYRALGFNRLSIGVQSFDETSLKALGRRHSGPDAERAFASAREAGFANVSLDLIYGAPGQTVEGARDDAARAARLAPEHLSVYGLMIEGLEIETPLARQVRRGQIEVPDDEAQWQMGEQIRAVLERGGYRRYEISNWARPGFESRHNSMYWLGGEYLGLGCGAVGFALEDPLDPSKGGRRWGNHRSPARYLEAVEAGASPEDWSERLEAHALLRERLAIGLRRVAGVDIEAVCAELRQDPEPSLRAARRLVERGLATLDGGLLRLTDRGLDFHTEAAVSFV